MQCPPDFVAATAVVGLGSLIGRQLGIRPKRRDDWTVIPNLWGGVVGAPGMLKTPAMQEAMRPLVRLEMQAKEQHERDMKRHEAVEVLAAEKKKLQQKGLQAKLKAGKDDATIISEMLAEGQENDPPARRRYILNDATVEKLGEILRDNRNGVSVFRDELTGWMRGLEREGREGDRAFYLEAWNGNGRFTYDRIGRGTVDIEAACVSLLGGIQPGPLAAYLASVKAGGIGDDGLLQRFQILVWPDPPREWRNVDEWPDRNARDRAFEAFETAANINLTRFGIEVPEDRDIPFVRFSEPAQDVFDEWRAALEARFLTGDLHPAFAAHLAKYRSLVPSLALIFHVADGSGAAVSEEACELAIAWAEYLESHARRAYDLGRVAKPLGGIVDPASCSAPRWQECWPERLRRCPSWRASPDSTRLRSAFPGFGDTA